MADTTRDDALNQRHLLQKERDRKARQHASLAHELAEAIAWSGMLAAKGEAHNKVDRRIAGLTAQRDRLRAALDELDRRLAVIDAQ